MRRSALIFMGLTWVTIAGPSRADDWMSVHGALQDIRLYYTAPIRWDEADWLAIAGTLAMVEATHSVDSRVRAHFAAASGALNGGKDVNSLRDAAPTFAIIAGTFAGAEFWNEHEGYRETWALVEAGALGSATAEAMSLAAGRERPDATASPNQWGRGGDSFPSLHVTDAFAVGTVFAESGSDGYRWLRRVIGYGIAAGTTYERLHENVHWLSDTAAGAALGVATARFVLNRRDKSDSSSESAWRIVPTSSGWQLAYQRRFR
jgi:membrane-associated phospholipid phosphatase